jgi:hypothetical protein
VEIRFEDGEPAVAPKKAGDAPQQDHPEKKVTIRIDQLNKRFFVDHG